MFLENWLKGRGFRRGTPAAIPVRAVCQILAIRGTSAVARGGSPKFRQPHVRAAHNGIAGRWAIVEPSLILKKILRLARAGSGFVLQLLRAAITLALISTPIFAPNAQESSGWHGTGVHSKPTPAHKRAFDKGASEVGKPKRLRADVESMGYTVVECDAASHFLHGSPAPNLSTPANLACVSCSNYPLTMNESRIWRPLS